MKLDKAAFEIRKGSITVRTLSESDVERCLALPELLDVLEAGFKALERGEVQAPARPEIVIPGKGFSLAMPAWQPGSKIAVKVVNVFDGNLRSGLPSHLSMITLYEADTGVACCAMDGTYITAVRTAASAALSVRMLARTNRQRRHASTCACCRWCAISTTSTFARCMATRPSGWPRAIHWRARQAA